MKETDEFDWVEADRKTAKLCPKCGCEMVDDVWPYIEGTECQQKCLNCGHEEKVKP